MAFFGSGYRIGLQDMQLLMDVCPLRVDSIFVRESHEDDFVVVPTAAAAAAAASQCTTTEEQSKPLTTHQSAATGTPTSLHCSKHVSAVLCISVLDIHQPVQITEAEVVRVRKRSRGLLLPPIFGGNNSNSNNNNPKK
jgi:hypothetical protein